MMRRASLNTSSWLQSVWRLRTAASVRALASRHNPWATRSFSAGVMSRSRFSSSSRRLGISKCPSDRGRRQAIIREQTVAPFAADGIRRASPRNCTAARNEDNARGTRIDDGMDGAMRAMAQIRG